MQQRKRELAERLQAVHSEANGVSVAERNSTTQGIANHVPQCASDPNDSSQQLPVASLPADIESNAVLDKSDALLCNSSSGNTCSSSLSTVAPRPTNKEIDSTSCADHIAAVVRDSGTPPPPEDTSTMTSKENGTSGTPSPPGATSTMASKENETSTASSSVKPDARLMNRDRRRQPVPMKDLLLHAPEMNLPWTPLRGVTQCSCGVPFTFTKRKVHYKPLDNSYSYATMRTDLKDLVEFLLDNFTQSL